MTVKYLPYDAPIHPVMSRMTRVARQLAPTIHPTNVGHMVPEEAAQG
jgi:hypothetical protein